MKTIYIWITFDNGSKISCGEMITNDTDPLGRFSCEFKYSKDYLNHPNCFALDPVTLPLSETIFSSDNPSGIFQIFEDSLPDDWGRRLLIKKAGLPPNRQKPSDLLLAIDGNAMGALSFYPSDVVEPKDNPSSKNQIGKLLKQAEGYEKGEYQDVNDFAELLNAGSSPGGARPKILLEDNEGISWLAKFPSFKDKYSINPIEYSTLQLAKKAGIPTPEFSLEKIGRKKVLLVKRFDVTKNNGRLHKLSFQTLLKASGYYFMSYKDLANIIRDHSRQPDLDLPNLFLQMCFNGYMGNTDDHLKNFSMLGNHTGYWLSPAYDLLPDVNEKREHTLCFDLDPTFPGYKELISIGKAYFGIRKPEKYIDQVRVTIKNWKKVFSRNKVPINEIQKLAKGINSRLDMK